MNDTQSERNKRLISKILMLAFVPMAILTIALLVLGQGHQWCIQVIALLRVYAIGLICFLCGIRAGIALFVDDSMSASTFQIALIPIFLSMLSALLGDIFAFALLATLFAAIGAWDQFAVSKGYAYYWYGRLRFWLTIGMVCAMIIAITQSAPIG